MSRLRIGRPLAAGPGCRQMKFESSNLRSPIHCVRSCRFPDFEISGSRLFPALAIAFCLFAAPARAQGLAPAQTRLSAATDGQRPASANAATQTFAGPIRLFDDLYYVGTDFVSAYVLVTTDGLVMFDSLYDAFTGEALDAMRAIGLDPADVKYVVVTHGHNDHAGGAARIRSLSGARVAMTAADWEIASGAGLDAPAPDGNIVIGDGDTLEVGGATLRFYVTPGHTPGVASTEFNVHDGATGHKAFLFGGHNVTSNDPDAFGVFIESVRRLQRDLEGVEVSLTSHPWAALIFERAALLEAREAGQPHPFVDPEDFEAFLAERLENGVSRLRALGESR